MTDDMLPLLMADVLPVTGIVSLDPPTVQCQECGATFTYRRLDYALLTHTTRLHHAHGGPAKRYCPPCFDAVACDCRQHRERW